MTGLETVLIYTKSFWLSLFGAGKVLSITFLVCLNSWVRSIYQVVFMYDNNIIYFFLALIILQDLLWLLFPNSRLSRSGFYANFLLCDGKISVLGRTRILMLASRLYRPSLYLVWSWTVFQQPLVLLSSFFCKSVYYFNFVLGLRMCWVLQLLLYLSRKPGAEVSASLSPHSPDFRTLIPAGMINFFIFHSCKSRLVRRASSTDAGSSSSYLCALHARKGESWITFSTRTNVVIVRKATLHASGSAQESI